MKATRVFKLTIIMVVLAITIGLSKKSYFIQKFYAESAKMSSIRRHIQNNAPPSLSCFTNVNISISSTGESVLEPGMFIDSSYINFDDLVVRIVGRPNPIITCEDVGKEFMAVITDPIANQTCKSAFLVEDKLPPVFECEDLIVPCGINPFASPPPFGSLITVTDNCDDDLNVQVVGGFDTIYNCPSEFTYEIRRTYRATDNFGNTSMCSNKVFFKRVVLDEVVFPVDTMMNCLNFNADTSIVGEPTYLDYPLRGVCDTWYLFDDDTIQMRCPGSFKIRRSWTVYDECTNQEPRSHVQMIQSIDTLKPTITCPANITLNTSAQSCSAPYTLARPQVLDSCTPSNDISIEYYVNEVLQPANVTQVTLPLGKNTIRVIANDNCNNRAECAYQVTVRDRVSPSLVCIDSITVSLNESGSNTVFADSLSNEFFVSDNCSSFITYKIKKMNDLLFADTVNYNCSEIGLTNRLLFQACDEAGNCNVCMIDIIVQDNAAPILICNPNVIEIDCYEYSSFDANDYLPEAEENCTMLSVTNRILNNDITCNRGTFDVEYTATDINGNQSSCIQNFQVNNPYTLANADIIFPDDVLLPGCNANPFQAAAGIPIVNSSYCNNVIFNAQLIDSTVDVSTNCKTYSKLWTIRDQCTLEERADTQFISVTGGVPPVFSNLPSEIYVNLTSNCTAFVDVPEPIIQSCTNSAVITNSFNDNGADADGNYPLGHTIVFFNAVDECNQETTFELVVTVYDTIKPIIQCPINLQRVINENGRDTIFLDEILANTAYSDNCTPKNQIFTTFDSLNLTLDSLIFICNDASGIPSISTNFYLIDQSNNITQCQLNVQYEIIPGQEPDCDNMMIIQGQVYSEKYDPIEHAEILATGDAEYMHLSEKDGSYKLLSINPKVDVTLGASKKDDPLNGVNIRDVVKIKNHILGTNEIPSPYCILAGDVNNDLKLNVNDVILIRNLILGKIDRFSEDENWKFVNRNIKFSKPKNPFLEPNIYSTQISRPYSIVPTVNMIGYKLGDVDQSATTSFTKAKAEIRSKEKQYLKCIAEQINTNEIMVSISIDEELKIANGQVEIQFDPSIMQFENAYFPNEIEFGSNQINLENMSKGKFTMAWDNITNGKNLSNLTFKVSESDQNEAFFSVLKSRILPIGFDLNTVKSYEIDLMTSGKWKTEAKLENHLLQNIPNPFTRETEIEIVLTEKINGVLSIYSNTGQLLYQIKKEFNKGFNTIRLNSEVLKGTGIFIYRFESDQFIDTKRMIKIL